MPFVQNHPAPTPDSCEVCRYLAEHPEHDRQLEHTLTQMAQGIIWIDLETADQPLRMRSVYQETIGYPGPEIRIDPRHWTLALLELPEVRLTAEGDAHDG